MSRNTNIVHRIDWLTVALYLVLVVFGWLNIYGASYDFDQTNIFDFSQRTGKQFVWILTAIGLSGIILLIDGRFYHYFAYYIYAFVLLLLIATIFLATDIKGSKSWLVLGPISFQPAELAKMATALALAKYMSGYNYTINTWRDLVIPALLLFVPFALIILQKETGSALVFVTFLLVFYREGMNGVVLFLLLLSIVLFVLVIKYSQILILGTGGALGIVLVASLLISILLIYSSLYQKQSAIASKGAIFTLVVGGIAYLLNFWVPVRFDYVAMGTMVAIAGMLIFVGIAQRLQNSILIGVVALGALGFSYSAKYLFDEVLQPHQQIRIEVLLGMKEDLMGAGYNVNQSKIAIGSGGFFGKGYLNGTQTKLKYVPEQDTDFIFCTVGEEHGFLGSLLILLIYWWFLMRIIQIAERQTERFNRIYAYSVASILFFHVMINIGMVLGLVPVIGIPLPFFSYGGSSLWSFTILLFVLIRLDTTRLERGHIRR